MDSRVRLWNSFKWEIFFRNNFQRLWGTRLDNLDVSQPVQDFIVTSSELKWQKCHKSDKTEIVAKNHFVTDSQCHRVLRRVASDWSPLHRLWKGQKGFAFYLVAMSKLTAKLTAKWQSQFGFVTFVTLCQWRISNRNQWFVVRWAPDGSACIITKYPASRAQKIREIHP